MKFPTHVAFKMVSLPLGYQITHLDLGTSDTEKALDIPLNKITDFDDLNELLITVKLVNSVEDIYEIDNLIYYVFSDSTYSKPVDIKGFKKLIDNVVTKFPTTLMFSVGRAEIKTKGGYSKEATIKFNELQGITDDYGKKKTFNRNRLAVGDLGRLPLLVQENGLTATMYLLSMAEYQDFFEAWSGFTAIKNIWHQDKQILKPEKLAKNDRLLVLGEKVDEEVQGTPFEI